jgi:hypothetical protein
VVGHQVCVPCFLPRSCCADPRCRCPLPATATATRRRPSRHVALHPVLTFLMNCHCGTKCGPASRRARPCSTLDAGILLDARMPRSRIPSPQAAGTLFKPLPADLWTINGPWCRCVQCLFVFFWQVSSSFLCIVFCSVILFLIYSPCFP